MKGKQKSCIEKWTSLEYKKGQAYNVIMLLKFDDRQNLKTAQ